MDVSRFYTEGKIDENWVKTYKNLMGPKLQVDNLTPRRALQSCGNGEAVTKKTNQSSKAEMLSQLIGQFFSSNNQTLKNLGQSADLN